MKENLFYLERYVTPDMVTDDSLGNIITYEDFKDSFPDNFSDEEDIIERNRCNALAGAVMMEMKRMREVLAGPSYSKSGVAWVDFDFWETIDGIKIPIKELEDEHICRIPRHLYRNHNMVNHKDDLPPRIVEEIERRGFSIDADCIVVKFKRGF